MPEKPTAAQERSSNACPMGLAEQHVYDSHSN